MAVRVLWYPKPLWARITAVACSRAASKKSFRQASLDDAAGSWRASVQNSSIVGVMVWITSVRPDLDSHGQLIPFVVEDRGRKLPL